MTTPDERTRALNETREFLLELSLWAGAPESSERWSRWHGVAGRLLRHYPGPEEVMWMQRLLEIRTPVVPAEGRAYWLGVAWKGGLFVASVVCLVTMVVLYLATAYPRWR